MLRIFAGPAAYQHIQQQGLQADHIRAVFGASGAAKWLAIYGLDRAIFGQWLTQVKQPIHLFGTSVGAWKLAAAAQRDPATALDTLAQAYTDQTYGENIGHADVIRETQIILQKFLPDSAITQILNNPRYHFNCGAVRAKGWLASEQKAQLLAALAMASARNWRGRRHIHTMMDRIVFSDPRANPPLRSTDGFITERYPLTTDNFRQALKASGSIPYVMPGIEQIPDVKPAMYRDGGLLDYHPVPSNFWQSEGLILYPHFYNRLVPGWFDKQHKNRHASSQQLNNVVLLCPSEEFVKSLPFGRLPDRQDFKRFYKRDKERQFHWQKTMEKSLQLGEVFMDWARTDKIKQQVELLGN